ncbi:MAG: mechanosensitive ion channel family protein [Myxococcota bacterium]|jgi:small-conductance mechanosensitive channel|nr:mechanosensitive ion channel family protein [Myxococcota bacterium]
MRKRARLAFFLPPLFLGCTIDKQEGGELSLLSTLNQETSDLASLWSLESILMLGLVIAIATLIAKAVTFAVRLAWRLGLDVDRRLSMWEQLARIAIILVVIGLASGAVAKVAPLTFSFAAVLLVAVCGLIAAPHIHAAIIGASLTLRRKLRVGDRIEVAGNVGIVREIGLTQVEIRKPDGSSALLPNRLLGEHPLNVARVHNSMPVSVTARLGSPVTPADLERARRVGLLCPHRATGSIVLVEKGAEPTDLLLVVQVWSENASRVAAAELTASLAQHLPGSP